MLNGTVNGTFFLMLRVETEIYALEIRILGGMLKCANSQH